MTTVVITNLNDHKCFIFTYFYSFIAFPLINNYWVYVYLAALVNFKFNSKWFNIIEGSLFLYPPMYHRGYIQIVTAYVTPITSHLRPHKIYVWTQKQILSSF